MKPLVIGIAGGTGSGKTTLTNRIKHDFADDVAILYLDNYYRAHDNLSFEERETINYDHPDALEIEGCPSEAQCAECKGRWLQQKAEG